MQVWAQEMCRNNAWLESLGGDPQEHQHPPVGIEFPDLPGSACVHKFHDGPTYGYSYTWKLFERLVKERPILVLYETPGRELIQHDITKEILGVRAGHGNESIDIKARKGVVLTCGGFENNQEMIRNYLPGIPYCYTSGSPYNEGDGITMAMSVGADLWHMNNYAGPSMALKVPEVRTSFSMQALHYSKETPGGMIVVGPDARRFTDEKFKTRHGKIPVNGRWLPLSTPCPMYLILRSHAVLRRPALRQAPEPRLDADRRALRLERGQQRRTGQGLDQNRRQPRFSRLGCGARPRRLSRHRRPWNRYCRCRTRPGFRPHPDDGADRRRAVLCGRTLALDAQHPGRPATQRAGADRAPRRHADPQALQRRRTGLDLQLSVPGHRQYRRMPGLRPHLGPQRRRRNALGLERPGHPRGLGGAAIQEDLTLVFGKRRRVYAGTNNLVTPAKAGAHR